MPRASEVLRSLPYPVLEDGNLSYPEGEYTVDADPQDDGTSVRIHHEIQGAPFLDRLLIQGQARYGCLISVPLTGYRKLHLSSDAYQRVQWDMAVVGEPPMLRPLIVSTTELSHTFGADDGVVEAWRGREIKLPKGARLALRGYLRSFSSLHELLEINQDQTLPNGSLEVKACEEDGFYFKVSVAPDLSLFLQNSGGRQDHRRSVLTHIVSRCFEILKQDYSDQSDDGEATGGWDQFRNLKALHHELIRRDLSTWEEDGFSPDKVATQRYPHRPPPPESEE